VQKKQPKRIHGLKGPYVYPNRRVIYFDPKQNEYYDPSTDFYLDRDELESLKGQIFDLVRG
jgi:hypothetical protein